jgi:PAS domain S-box-containing protein
MEDLKRVAKRHAVALVVTALAFPFALVLWSLDQRVLPLVLFVAAVTASAWLGGPKSATLTTILLAGALFATFALFFSDKSSQRAVDFLLLLLGLIFLGLCTSYISREIRRARFATDQVPDISSSAGEALIATDTQGVIISINPLAQYLTGWPAADAIGQYLETVLRVVDPETGREIDSLTDRASMADATNRVDFQGVLISYQRTQTKIEGNAVPFSNGGRQAKALTVLFRDVAHKGASEDETRRAEERAAALANELKEAERRLQETVRSAQEHLENLTRKHADERSVAAEKMRQEREEHECTTQELEKHRRDADALRESHGKLLCDLEEARTRAESQAKLLKEVNITAEAHARLSKELEEANVRAEERTRLSKELEEANIRAELAEEALQSAQEELATLRSEQEQQRQQSEVALQEARTQLLQEIQKRDAEHAQTHSSLLAELAEHRASGEALRQSHDRLATVLETLPAPISIKDANGKYLHVNREFESICGLGKAQLVGSNGFATLIPPEYQTLTDAEMRVLQEGVPSETEEVFNSVSGNRTYRAFKIPLRDPSGEIRAIGSVYSQARRPSPAPRPRQHAAESVNGIVPAAEDGQRPAVTNDWLSFN